MIDTLRSMLRKEIKVILKHDALVHAVHKGILIEVGMNYIMLQTKKEHVIIPLEHITSIHFT
jgi:hypothetical protein